jgi:hypothetical protein
MQIFKWYDQDDEKFIVRTILHKSNIHLLIFIDTFLFLVFYEQYQNFVFFDESFMIPYFVIFHQILRTLCNQHNHSFLENGTHKLFYFSLIHH